MSAAEGDRSRTGALFVVITDETGASPGWPIRMPTGWAKR